MRAFRSLADLFRLKSLARSAIASPEGCERLRAFSVSLRERSAREALRSGSSESFRPSSLALLGESAAAFEQALLAEDPAGAREAWLEARRIANLSLSILRPAKEASAGSLPFPEVVRVAAAETAYVRSVAATQAVQSLLDPSEREMADLSILRKMPTPSEIGLVRFAHLRDESRAGRLEAYLRESLPESGSEPYRASLAHARKRARASALPREQAFADSLSLALDSAEASCARALAERSAPIDPDLAAFRERSALSRSTPSAPPPQGPSGPRGL